MLSTDEALISKRLKTLLFGSKAKTSLKDS
ncbi:MAG: hypothetical protein CM15mP123_10800 [Gammaproteobacteria bacterium]|nr:MAG: hypothetical protein CM15mP123_10800 [Gammaproteobacteria bacterium]